MCLQLLALELECIGHQPCLRRPGLWAQTDLARNLKSLQLGYVERKIILASNLVRSSPYRR